MKTMPALKWTTVDLEDEKTLPYYYHKVWIAPRKRGGRRFCLFGERWFSVAMPDVWEAENTRQRRATPDIKSGDRWAYVEWPGVPK